jgi:hypothetical protein
MGPGPTPFPRAGVGATLERSGGLTVSLVSNPTDDCRAEAFGRNRIQARLCRTTLQHFLPTAEWSPAFTPTLKSLEGLRGMLPPLRAKQILDPPKGLTAFEKAAGRPLVFAAKGNPFDAQLKDKARLFDEQILPATQKLDTRMGYWGAWRSFVTFMVMSGSIEQTLPASEEAIKAFAMHLVMIGYAGASIQRFFEAIIDRHRLTGIDTAVPARTIRMWVEAIQKQLGLPKRDKFFILPIHIKCILQLGRTTLKELRDATIVVVGTVCALRAKEVTRLDVCDLLWEYDGVDTLALLLWYRKNDGFKRGLNPRIGKGSLPETCPLMLIREYLRRSAIKVSSNCTKARWTRSPCDACGRLFRNTTAAGTRMEGPRADWMLGKGVVRDAVKDTLMRIGVAPDNYSPISMRRGGVSAAVAGGVSETLWKLQSGHRGTSWQNYADIIKVPQLYHFFEAFNL